MLLTFAPGSLSLSLRLWLRAGTVRMQAFGLVRGRWTALRASGREYVQQRPRLRWTLFALSWLPLGIFVTEYGFNIKSVRGRSMQVRDISDVSDTFWSSQLTKLTLASLH